MFFKVHFLYLDTFYNFQREHTIIPQNVIQQCLTSNYTNWDASHVLKWYLKVVVMNMHINYLLVLCLCFKVRLN